MGAMRPEAQCDGRVCPWAQTPAFLNSACGPPWLSGVGAVQRVALCPSKYVASQLRPSRCIQCIRLLTGLEPLPVLPGWSREPLLWTVAASVENFTQLGDQIAKTGPKPLILVYTNWFQRMRPCFAFFSVPSLLPLFQHNLLHSFAGSILIHMWNKHPS